MDNLFPIYLFIDSNSYIGARYNFNGGSLLKIRNHIRNGKIKLLTNTIVIEEVKSHIKSEVFSNITQINKILKKLEILSNSEINLMADYFNRDNLDEPLQRLWMDFNTDCVVLDNSDVQLNQVLSDYFDLKPPFEVKKKSEFPDAIIIKSLQQYFYKQKNDILYMITRDQGWKNAFTEKDKIKILEKLEDVFTVVSEAEFPNEAAVLNLAFKKGKYNDDLDEAVNEIFGDSSCPEDDIDCNFWNNIDYITEIEMTDVLLVDWGKYKYTLESIDGLNETSAEITINVQAEIKIEFKYYDNELILKKVVEIHECAFNIEIALEYNNELEYYEFDHMNDFEKIIISNDTLLTPLSHEEKTETPRRVINLFTKKPIE